MAFLFKGSFCDNVTESWVEEMISNEDNFSDHWPDLVNKLRLMSGK